MLMNQIRWMLQTLAVAVLLASGAAPAMAQSTGQTALADALAGQHPSKLMEKARDLFAGDRVEDAAFLFYLGQLRWSVDRLARASTPDQPDAGLADMNARIGIPINAHLRDHMEIMAASLKAARAYERAQPDLFTPITQFGPVWESQLAAFDEFTAYVEGEARMQAMRGKAGMMPAMP
jgi:hypothetical protein